MLEHASILVAPSLREGRWREQVGNPILEALATGTTVVTTTETGIADWLLDHGHHVIRPAHLRERLGPAIIDALQQPLPIDRVLASLPTEDGRALADAWLHD
jgi:glycosyltransferase involved in cell wall biosynthesis